MKVSFIGGGNMATALIAGLARMPQSISVTVVEPMLEQRERLLSNTALQGERLHIDIIEQVNSAVSQSDVIVLAVKPQNMQAACAAIHSHSTLTSALIVSIAAGTLMRDIANWLSNTNARIVRCMPNTPATLGLGITGLVANAQASVQDKALAQTIMQAAGQTLWVDNEDMIDAVTAVSGSGPGYVFYLMEALQNAAQAQGFTAEQARLLTEHTFAGSAQLALHTGTSFSVLREQVTSKGGTTHAGLEAMREKNVAAAIESAVSAAKRRAHELSGK